MQNIIPITAREETEAGDANPLAVGTRVADFEITGVIGEGGFGIVYLAFDHLLQRTVAIKEYMPAMLARRGKDKSVVVRLPRDQKTFDTGLKSFINEARILAQFDHPALIKVYRFWEENNTAYMAMRYYEGVTLKKVISDTPELVTQAWLKGMLKPIMEALDALYKVSILHRDISPDNILIQHNGEAVLLDFGAARQIIGGVSRALTVILKPGYAPIEQYADDSSMEQGPWTDIYSLSAVVYLAIARQAPPTSVARMIKDPIVPLQNGSHAGFDKDFLAAIDKGLAVKPEDRPQSIDEFRRLLQLELSVPVPTMPVMAVAAGAADKPGRPAATAPKPAADPRPAAARRPASMPIVLIAAGLCLAAAASYFALRPKPIPVIMPAAVHAQAEIKLAEQTSSAVAPQAAPASGNAEAVSSPPAVRPAAQASGTVRINIKPWGTVYVDGVSKGVSPPLKKLALSEGEHSIRIVNPNFPSRTVQIEVSKNKAGSIDHDFSKFKK